MIAGGATARCRAVSFSPHGLHEFVMYDFDKLLAGIERIGHHLPQGFGLDLFNEGLDHRQGDVCFQQRHAHITQRFADVFFRQLGAAGDAAHGLSQALRKILKHIVETEMAIKRSIIALRAAKRQTGIGSEPQVPSAGMGYRFWAASCYTRQTPSLAHPPLIASIAILLYLSGFVMRWRLASQGRETPLQVVLTLAALAMHGIAASNLLFVAGGIDLSLITVLVLVAFVLVGVLAITNLRLPVGNLYLLLFPISMLALSASLLAPASTEPLTHLNASQVTHILVSLAAYSALLMAACQSILVAVQERHLRSPRRTFTTLLPPMETMERLLLAMIWIGFALLSGAVLSGYLFFDDIFARQALHHVVLTSLSWLVYVGFLIGHHVVGWRGMTAVRWTLAGFALLLLGYIGTKFVLEYVLS